MVFIKVDQKDKLKVFGILLHNGKFSRIHGLFRIDENEENGLQQIKDSGINFEIVS